MNNEERLIGQEIIYALRSGAVPQRALTHVAVMDSSITSEINNHLTYVEQGNTSFKFICGDYGSGKTFHCYAIAEHSLEKGFATSVIDVSQGTFSSPLSMYRLIIQNLHINEKRTASAISDILEKWLFGIQKKLEKLDGLKITGPTREKALERLGKEIEKELVEFSQLDITLANVVKAYFYGKVSKDETLCEAALKWLKASPNLTNDEKKSLGLKKDITDETVSTMMMALATIIHKSGCAGWVLVFDELTTLQRLPNAKQRVDSYEILRKYIDEIAAKKYPYCFFIFAGITRLFDDPKFGIKSHEPLYGRITSPKILPGFSSSKENIIRLKGFDAQSIVAVARKIIKLHSLVYDWNPTEKVSDAFLKTLSEYMTTSFGDIIKEKPRKVLQELICFLDKLEENPELDPNTYLKEKEPVFMKEMEAPS
jgi:hypothetical protein